MLEFAYRVYHKNKLIVMEESVVNEVNNISQMAEEIRRKYTNLLNEKCMEKRIYKEKKRDRPDGPFQRDFSRIMYASSFRRLQGKMQLLGIRPDQFFRNRLTHSLEVSQIARSIACMAKYSLGETYVVEAGSLSHDIGNPPFGHSGERKLNELFKEIGGFEGNAQTLRILKSLERKKPNFDGLNLTYRTLFSVVKYFKKQICGKDETTGEILYNSKFIYDEDYEILKKFIDEHDVMVRTFDVQIVDIADAIAYAAHDLEDGLRQKCYTIEEILHDYHALYGCSDSYKKLAKIVNKAREDSGFGKKNVDSSEYSKMFRQELSSKIINVLINDLGICHVSEEFVKKTGTMHKKELGFIQYGELAEGLKEITFKCINHNDEVYSYEKRGNIVIEKLVDIYRNDCKLLPPEYQVDKKNRENNSDI